MSKWKLHNVYKDRIHDDDGNLVAECKTKEHAKTIILEHNALAALLEACEQNEAALSMLAELAGSLIRRKINTGYDTRRLFDLGVAASRRNREAIALAKEPV